MNDEFGDFEEPQIESPPLIKIEEKKNNSNEYQINNNMNKEPLVKFMLEKNTI